MTPGLSIQNLTYTYGDRKALDDISFEVGRGQFCALLGPNGAGKSTLFALLTRLFTSSCGQIHIAGHDTSRSPRLALARMGVVFQAPTLDMDLTVRQNLSYFAALHGLSDRYAARLIDASLERLGIRDRATEKARNLNGGHRRRTEIARALIHQPEVLLLDEPTVGLDAATRQSITAHVHDLAETDGITVLWATHLTDEVRGSDQLVVLHQGRILQDGRAGELCANVSLQQHFINLTAAPI